jgi:hypothetical protein
LSSGLLRSFYIGGFCNDFTSQAPIYNHFTRQITVLPAVDQFLNMTPLISNDFARNELFSNHFIGKATFSNYITRRIIILRGHPMEINILEFRPAGYAYLLEESGFSMSS